MRTVIWFIYFWAYLVLVYPKQRKYQALKKAGKLTEAHQQEINDIVEKWAQRLLWVAGLKCQVYGTENLPKDRAVLFTPNHQGNFDIPLVITRLGRIHPLVAKDSLEKVPFLAAWMKLFDCLFLDRGNPRASVKTFARAEELIKEGKSVIIFPEGTRSKGEEMGEFKEGAFKIALKTGADVVPVSIDGSYKAMEMNGFWIHPAEVKLTILPAIKVADLEGDEKKHLGKRVSESIIKARDNTRAMG